jgi:glutamine cyclotransferase
MGLFRWYDFGPLVKEFKDSDLYKQVDFDRGSAVLNGIAYSEEEDIFYITGKYWPKLYKVKLREST